MYKYSKTKNPPYWEGFIIITLNYDYGLLLDAKRVSKR